MKHCNKSQTNQNGVVNDGCHITFTSIVFTSKSRYYNQYDINEGLKNNNNTYQKNQNFFILDLHITFEKVIKVSYKANISKQIHQLILLKGQR